MLTRRTPKSMLLFMLLSATFASPVIKTKLSGRHTRSSDVHLIQDCESQIWRNGIYQVSSPSGTQVCKILLVASPEYVVRVDFHQFDVACDADSFMGFLDGWEYFDQILPGPYDTRTPLDQRQVGFCGLHHPQSPLVSGQNTAELLYQLPPNGGGFQFKVSFVHNPSPCSVLLTEPMGTYTMVNHGKKSNCSVTVMEPVIIQVDSIDTGMNMLPGGTPKNIGFGKECRRKKGKSDLVEFLFGNEMEPSMLNYGGELCGQWAENASKKYSLPCGTSVVRLQSSGAFFNSVTFSYRAMTDDDLVYLMSQGVDLDNLC